MFKRGTNIPPVNPGETVSGSLINQVIKGADNVRQVSAGKGIKASMLNNGLNVGLTGGSKPTQVPVQIDPYGKSSGTTSADTSLTQLDGGFYYARSYMQPQQIYKVISAPTQQKVLPDPSAINCVVINYSEFYAGKAFGHAILAPTQAIATYIGSTTDGLPLYGVSIDSLRYGKVISVGAINGAIQWRYTIQFGYRTGITSTSIGTYTSDSTTNVSAFNSCEDLNTFTGSGTTGIGVTAASTTGIINAGTCVLKAIPVNSFVWCKYIGLDTSNNPYFSIVNFSNAGQ